MRKEKVIVFFIALFVWSDAALAIRLADVLRAATALRSSAALAIPFKQAARAASTSANPTFFEELAADAEIARQNCLTGVPPSRLRDHAVRFVEAIEAIAATARRVGSERALDGLPGSVNDWAAQEAYESWRARYDRSDRELQDRGAQMDARMRKMYRTYDDETSGSV